MHPIKSTEMLAKWQENRKPLIIFFLIYSLITRAARILVIKSESNAPIELRRKDSLFNKNYKGEFVDGVDIGQQKY